jgi:hypothetical protein
MLIFSLTWLRSVAAANIDLRTLISEESYTGLDKRN